MADVQHIIEGAVRTALTAIPVDRVDVALKHDHSDEEAYYIVVDVPPSAPQVGGQKLLAAIMGANDALLAVGDHRFPYIRIRYLGEEQADEGEPARASDP